MKHIKEYIHFTNQYAIKHAKVQIIINSVIFVVLAIASFFAIRFLPIDSVKELYEAISEMLNSKDLTNSDGTLSFWGVFLNNLKACGLICLSGLIPILFLPVLYLSINAGVIGAFMGIIDVMTVANVILMFVMFVLPHGVFEIPAMILSGAIGSKLCAFYYRKMFGFAKEEKFLFHIKGCLGMFIFYAFPLLLIAGFIEAVVLSAVYL